ncbi:uncharacterized protein BP5553_08934 [Venustampulla echinocandica]|uniref:Xylanolytic transcriptional activator regulatory domain-containing protein n=1 Tax=Venustampulla echinocandica TaxID=2656787 RepID=A0A370TDC5_9HELO|nr:uncharacterized protein BP5553_08934 [Venustampulla echinocandica]RDL32478.1 hypothetical protein BP5553_08934 [Venustampulla echinocandica]
MQRGKRLVEDVEKEALNARKSALPIHDPWILPGRPPTSKSPMESYVLASGEALAPVPSPASDFVVLRQRLERVRSKGKSSQLPRQQQILQARTSPASPPDTGHQVDLPSSPQSASGGEPQQPQGHAQPQQNLEQAQQQQQQQQPSRHKHRLVLNDKDMVEEDLARTALTKFLRRGFKAPTWSVFQPCDPIRVAYVGTPTSNLAYLVGQESPHRGDASLHFLFPSIRPALPWKPSKDMSLVKWYSSMADDVSLLPEKEVCDQLVEAFFTKIHPGFPVLDEAEFRLQYADDMNPVPLLILQSVLLAGAQVCDHPEVVKSRSLIKVALFRRAKALFDLRYENNREHLVQAALLFTWHSEGADDIGVNAYYWIGVAIRIAFGLGLHRNLSPSTRSVIPLQDRRIQRRLWYVLFQYDVLASLQHGRPLIINDDDCDQPPLVTEDFIEIDGHINKNIRADYCMQSIKLCHIIVSILKLFSPGSLRRHHMNEELIDASRTALDSQLEAWIISLPPHLANPSRRPQDFWCTQIHLHYNLALLQLYRTTHLASRSFSPQVSISLNHSPKSVEICHNSATSISQLFSTLLMSRKIDQCCFTALSLLLASAIQISLKARFASSSSPPILALQAQSRLEDLFPVMEEVAKYWPSVEAIHRLFRGVLGEMKLEFERNHTAESLQSMQGSGPVIQPVQTTNFGAAHGPFAEIGLSDGDWNVLLGTWDAPILFDDV